MGYFTIAWRNIGRNRRRSVLSIVAAAIAALSIVLLFGLIGGIAGDLTDNLIGYSTGEVRIRHRDYTADERLSPLHLAVDRAGERIDRLQASGINAVPRLSFAGGVFGASNRHVLLITGVDFDLERGYSGIDRRVTAGDYHRVSAGVVRPSAGPVITRALVGNRVPEELGLSLGDTFTVVARGALGRGNAMTFRIAAIADFPVAGHNARAVWIPLERAQRFAFLPDQAGELLVRFAATVEPARAVERVAAAIDTTGLEVRHWSAIDTSYRFIEMANTWYAIIGIVFFLLAATVIVNTTMMAIHERRREIGTLAAIGCTPGQIVRLFWIEASLLGLLGSALGVALGVAVVWLTGTTGIDFGAQVESTGFELSNVLHPRISATTAIVIFGSSCAVGSLASLLPTRRIAQLQPVAALREA